MPRKIDYGFDYDDDHDDYEYDYDEDGELDTVQVDHMVPKSSLWRCSICTYDNDQSLLSCDICGTVRNVSTISCNKTDNKTVPFKFDTPSPDDLVSVGKRSSVKAKSRELASVKVPSSGNKEGACKTEENVEKLKNPSILVSEVSRDIKSSNNNKGTTVKAMKIYKTDNSSAIASKSILRNEDKKGSSSTDENNIQASTSGLGNLSLDTNTTKSNLNIAKCVSQAQYKPENWMFPDQGEEISNQLSLAIIGHVDSGKSTLSGRILHLMGRISQKDMHKYEKESKQKGKGSFAYAWALDESAQERVRGITMTVAVAYFKTEKYDVVLLDSPGHKDFVPNMISGAVQADAAVLVVDASVGSFEAGMEGNGGGGQTKEHTQLIRSFGAEQLIVAVNKMDVVDYSVKRFEIVKSELGTFLKSCGFRESLVSWVPLSAMENQNLVAPASDSRLSSWYQGPHLLDAINSLQPPVRDIHQPLCIPICDVVKSHLSGQLAVIGKLEGGAVKIGSRVLVMPSGDLATVRSIVRDSNPCAVARAGDSVSVYLQGIDEGRLITGGVLCHPDFPVAIATHLELKILVLDVAVPILVGSQVEFHIHHAKEAARVLKISSVIDLKSGKVSRRDPRCLLAKQSAGIEVILDRPVCASTFSGCRALGRVSLRASGKTIAVGIVSRIVGQEN